MQVQESLTESASNIFCGSMCKQMDKKQDLGVHGVYEKGYYIGAFDGHGTDDCIRILRQLDYSVIANNPVDIKKATDGWLYNSGSTMNFTTIEMNKNHENHETQETQENEDEIIVTNYNAGDSECMIFVNDQLVFESVPHTLLRPGERDRVRPFLQNIRPITGAWAPIPLSDRRMTVHRSDISNYKTGESLVPTMALGHNNMTGFDPDINVLRFKSTDHVRIVSGSDGFWGMIVKTLDEPRLKTAKLEELVDFAEKRWKQEWEYAGDVNKPDNIEMTHFPGYDDITVCIWDNKYQ
jgi:hypothetical protein